MIRVNENTSIIRNKDIKTERRVVDMQLPDGSEREGKVDRFIKFLKKA